MVFIQNFLLATYEKFFSGNNIPDVASHIFLFHEFQIDWANRFDTSKAQTISDSLLKMIRLGFF